MGRSRRAIIFVAAFTLVGCSTRMIPASTPTRESAALHLFATSSTLPLAQELTRAYAAQNPFVTFEIQTGSYSAMLGQLMAGEVGYLLTNHLDAPGTARGDLWAAPIAQDGIAIIVHPTNPVLSLSRGELQQLFEGRVARWSELDGLPLEVNIYSHEAGAPTWAEFEALVMGDRTTTLSARVAPSSSAVVQSVAGDPGGVGYVSMAFVDERVRALPIDGVLPSPVSVADNSYPLRSMIYLAGLREPDGTQPLDLDYRAFIGWVQSLAGQSVVGRHYGALLEPATS